MQSRLFENKLSIIDIVDRSAAMRSGLRKGDEIIAVDRRKVQTPEELKRTIGSYAPGDRITIEVVRNDATKEFPVLLGSLGSSNQRGPYDQWGGGPFSERRFGFTSVLTHDGAIAPEDCGGPIVNVRGEIVGVNISRALRVATYSLATDQVDRIVESIVNARAIKE